MSNNYNPFNNWGNQKVVITNKGDRQEGRIESNRDWGTYIAIAIVLLLAAKYLGIH